MTLLLKEAHTVLPKQSVSGVCHDTVENIDSCHQVENIERILYRLVLSERNRQP
jgi:hypothetical protein